MFCILHFFNRPLPITEVHNILIMASALALESIFFQQQGYYHADGRFGHLSVKFTGLISSQVQQLLRFAIEHLHDPILLGNAQSIS